MRIKNVNKILINDILWNLFFIANIEHPLEYFEIIITGRVI